MYSQRGPAGKKKIEKNSCFLYIYKYDDSIKRLAEQFQLQGSELVMMYAFHSLYIINFLILEMVLKKIVIK